MGSGGCGTGTWSPWGAREAAMSLRVGTGTSAGGFTICIPLGAIWGVVGVDGSSATLDPSAAGDALTMRAFA